MICTRHIALCLAISASGFGASPALAQRNPRISTKPAGKAIGESVSTQPAEQNERPNSPGLRPANPTSLQTVDEQLYIEAADRGEAWAQIQLAEVYLRPPTEPRRIEAAVNLLKLAALQDDAIALYKLGALAMEGRGMPPSPTTAFEYCKRSAELGYDKAQYELAALYALGRGTSIDEEEAIKWGRKAIAQENSKAKYSIGRLLLLREQPAQKDEAVSLLEQASAAGIAEAGVLLAESYAQGLHGLDKNAEKARALLQPHADAGNKEAVEMLGNIPVAEN